MDSALRPRDIQARIRAGESPEDVAAAAGVPVERIDAFAAPVMAERDHVSGLARTHPVRRRGETTSHRTLRNAVADALATRGLDVDDLVWDAWKLEDRRWQVLARFAADGVDHEARFVFDQVGRFSMAVDDEARALIGDENRDTLALVEATRPDAAPALPNDDATEQEADTQGDVDVPEESPVVEEPVPGLDTRPDEAAGEDGDDTEDAFRDGDLLEVEGVFDIVPSGRGDLDALYEMLSSFDEDSVKIYAGLVHPKEGGPAPDAPVLALDESAPDEPEADDKPEDDDEPEHTGIIPRPEPVETPPAARPRAPRPAAAPAPETPAADEPEQLSLIDDVEPAPAKPRPRRKRASVPSWDEIMFGSPRSED